MVSLVNSGLGSVGLNPGQGHCIVFLGNTHCQGVDTGESLECNPMHGGLASHPEGYRSDGLRGRPPGSCTDYTSGRNRPFYSCVLSYLAMNTSEAGGDLALIQTSLPFSCKCNLVSIRTT